MTRLGEFAAAPRAAKQRLAGKGLQRLDVLADRGGGDAKLVGGAGKAAVAGGGVEGAQRGNWRQAFSRLRFGKLAHARRPALRLHSA